MKKPLKLFLFVTTPIWGFPFLLGALIKIMYEEFDDCIDPKENKDEPKYKRMTNYDA